MSTQLIPVVASVIGNQTVQTVDGRALHSFLEVGKAFAAWIQDRIDMYQFEQGKDFEVFSEIGKNPQGGRPAKEYTLTLDMGKELAMVERTAKGKQARQYFIECERRLLAAPSPDPLATQGAELLQGKVLVDAEAVRQTVYFHKRILPNIFALLESYSESLDIAELGRSLASIEQEIRPIPQKRPKRTLCKGEVLPYQPVQFRHPIKKEPLIKRLFQFIAERGKHGANHRLLYQGCRAYRIASEAERADVLNRLLVDGEIVQVQLASKPGARRKAPVFVEKSYAPAALS